MSNKKTFGKGDFQGVLSLMLTPFQGDGSIDWNVYDQYTDWQLSHGPKGLFAVCGSSEMKWLSLEERLKLAQATVKRAGEVPVVATANIGGNIDNHADELARMTDTGIAGVVLVPPDGLGQDSQKLADYFMRMIDSASVPVFLYEWPQVSPYFIPDSVYGKLAATGKVIGIKDTTCTMEGIAAKIKAAPDSLVLQANTPFMLESIREGVQGIMATTSAAAAWLLIDFWNKAVNRDPDAERLHHQLVFLDSVQRFAYPATSKYLAQLQGVPISLQCRWPVTLKAEDRKAISLWYDFVRSTAAVSR